jgi:hypothetical protein
VRIKLIAARSKNFLPSTENSILVVKLLLCVCLIGRRMEFVLELGSVLGRSLSKNKRIGSLTIRKMNGFVSKVEPLLLLINIDVLVLSPSVKSLEGVPRNVLLHGLGLV